jgi:hypothetical protein
MRVTPNGYWFQELRAKRINGRWSQAYRVRNKKDEIKDEILIEKIDDDYPRDSKGESIW